MYNSRSDKGKKRPIRYQLMSFYELPNGEKIGVNISTAKNKTGVDNFVIKHRGYDRFINTNLKVECKDLKTGKVKIY